MISSLPGPLLTIVIGYPICSSINSIYFLQFSGSSSYVLIPRISHFHPGSVFNTGFAFSRSVLQGTLLHFSIDLIAYTYRNLIQISKYIQNCKRYICRPLLLHPYLEATQSNHPIRLGRPVVAPNSPPSPPRRLSSSASSPKISLTNAPAPTALEYALHTVMICLISYGGIPAPIAPYAASVEEDVTIG